MRHPVIGLTGLPCTGKSFVGGIFVGLGAAVLHTDQLGHAVLEEDEIKNQLLERFGDGILDDGGRVDRGRVAARVFARPDAPALPGGEDADRALVWLESLVHPRIQKRALEWIDAHRAEQPVVVEAALLAQSGLAELCDIVLVLESDDAVRRERAAGHRQWTAEMLAARDGRLRETIESLHDADATERYRIPGRIVFLTNNGRPAAPLPMTQLLEPLRELLKPLPEE